MIIIAQCHGKKFGAHINGHCYYVSETLETWQRSRDICEAMDSQLASFHSREEAEAVEYEAEFVGEKSYLLIHQYIHVYTLTSESFFTCIQQ